MDKIARIRQEVEELYTRIDKCIDTLIKARLNKDTNGEGKSLFQMEGLMVGTQQFLCWILDTLSEEPDKSLEEAAQQYAEGPECTWVGTTALEEAFIAGAKWQKEQMLKDYSWLIAPSPNIEPKADIIHTTDTAPVDGKELLHVADKSYKIGWRDCKQQMLKAAVEGEAEELYNDGESQCVVSVGTYFKPGDEVYVIPKEEEK